MNDQKIISFDDFQMLMMAAATLYGISEALGEDGLKALLTPEQKEAAAKAAIQFVEDYYEDR